MNKFLPLVIVMCVLISGCNSTSSYRKVLESEIPNYKNQISDSNSGEYSPNWVQPINKSEKCEFLFEGYDSSYVYPATEWHGECKDGKAEGLGEAIIKTGSIDRHEITYHNKGITDQFYYQWVEGTNNVEYGAYIRENDRMTKVLKNNATLNPNGDIDFVYSIGEQNLVTGDFKGVVFNKYTDGMAKYTGEFGNKLFFGVRESFDQQSKPQYTFWGYYDANIDKPAQFVILKNDAGLWHQEYQFGNLKENVQLPNSYTNSVMQVSNEATKSSNAANGAAQLAIAMKKKYDALNISSPSTSASPHNPSPEKTRGISTGTGFFVSNDGYVLTNSHVIEGSSNISIILGGKSVSAILVDHDSSNDIALLKVNETVEGLPIELKKKTKQGSEIAVLGYPNIGLQGNEQKATFGYINANSGIQGDTRYFQISSPIQPGNSGSPMVNDQGVVIGIASASLNQTAAIQATGTLAQNVNYAVKIAYALPMLINHGVEYIELATQESLEKTDLIESISDSVVLVVAE
jgi:S1-C subfamily serine protease